MDPSTKQALRKRYREKRMGLSPEEFQRLNDGLILQAEVLDLEHLRTVHLFLPITGNNEPDTYAITGRLRQRYPNMRIVLPKTEPGTREMKHFVWDANTALVPNHWGIPEPVTGTAVRPHEIDAVFLPLLVFDQQGHRIGYGKGFYDRFLAECRPAAQKIGLSLFEGVKSISDISSHDVAMDLCVTPTRIWTFNTVP
ncbi:5-formyltetrahydrofolate cyclo-ligase [Parapedobacter sp. 10938]|uniref:5-formyltetrahydrofolate cyclo-ligase n=1 Tax=Parapedobacter flavus TaxID=3110225 RepID=UPI002DBFC116|nr:5-formyltetrahydrofolate cyclo-ligase [Parapedobacter sp. 10938]MEC3878037.1 5-formyltetrahydrofolate cyclo-ligase [Parapedobacter sp. 10938]